MAYFISSLSPALQWQTYHILIFSVWISSDHFISWHMHWNMKQSRFLTSSRALVNIETYVKFIRSWNLKTLTATRIISANTVAEKQAPARKELHIPHLQRIVRNTCVITSWLHRELQAHDLQCHGTCIDESWWQTMGNNFLGGTVVY